MIVSLHSYWLMEQLHETWHTQRQTNCWAERRGNYIIIMRCRFAFEYMYVCMCISHSQFRTPWLCNYHRQLQCEEQLEAILFARSHSVSAEHTKFSHYYLCSSHCICLSACSMQDKLCSAQKYTGVALSYVSDKTAKWRQCTEEWQWPASTLSKSSNKQPSFIW